jgi:hypothetical protein
MENYLCFHPHNSIPKDVGVGIERNAHVDEARLQARDPQILAQGSEDLRGQSGQVDLSTNVNTCRRRTLPPSDGEGERSFLVHRNDRGEEFDFFLPVVRSESSITRQLVCGLSRLKSLHLLVEPWPQL